MGRATSLEPSHTRGDPHASNRLDLSFRLPIEAAPHPGLRSSLQASRQPVTQLTPQFTLQHVLPTISLVLHPTGTNKESGVARSWCDTHTKRLQLQSSIPHALYETISFLYPHSNTTINIQQSPSVSDSFSPAIVIPTSPSRHTTANHASPHRHQLAQQGLLLGV